MNKLALLGAVMLIVASTTGCGCLGILRPRTQTVAMPAISTCAPTCAPACNSCGTCDGCGCNGGEYYGGMYGEPTVAP